MHKELVEQARAAITDVFSDQTVSRTQTKESLYELIGEIKDFINALDSDDANDEGN
jgi:hypothetical protein